MEEARYHKRLGFPEGTDDLLSRFLDGFGSVRYSTHAKYETIQDSRGIIPVLKKSDLCADHCFEIVVVGQQIVKAAFQIIGNKELNYAYVISCEGVVITCWANAEDDDHQTLDETKYIVYAKA